MKSSRSWTWTLTAAGLLQIGLAIAHYGLPTMFDWSSGITGGVAPQLRWVLFLFNFSWSTVILGVGALMLYAARLNTTVPFARRFVLMAMLFWIAHGSYMVAEPMPLPGRLAWLQAPLLAFPVTLVALLGASLFTTRQSRTHFARVGI